MPTNVPDTETGSGPARTRSTRVRTKSTGRFEHATHATSSTRHRPYPDPAVRKGKGKGVDRHIPEDEDEEAEIEDTEDAQYREDPATNNHAPGGNPYLVVHDSAVRCAL